MSSENIKNATANLWTHKLRLYKLKNYVNSDDYVTNIIAEMHRLNLQNTENILSKILENILTNIEYHRKIERTLGKKQQQQQQQQQ